MTTKITMQAIAVPEGLVMKYQGAVHGAEPKGAPMGPKCSLTLENLF